jgi:Ca2+/H+ antiporter
MYPRDYRDIVSGAGLIAFGLWFAWYAYTHYRFGTLVRIGDGMFPVVLGCMLAFFGAVILVGGLLKRGPKVQFAAATALCILLGVAAFALVVPRFGLVPAIVALALISALADIRKFSVLSLSVLCAALSLLTYLIFKVGLGLAMPMFAWPQ